MKEIPGGWQMTCQLQEQGFSYCGLNLAIPPSDSSTIDLRDLSEIELTLRNTSNGLAKIILAAHDPSITRSNIPLSHRYSETKIDKHQGHVAIPASDLRLATWWLDLGMVSPKETELRLDRLHGVSIQINANGSNRPDTVEVTDLRMFTRPRASWGWISLLWGSAILLGWFQWRKRKPVPTTPSTPDQEIPSPEPLALKSASDESRERLVSWLRQHYMDSDLDADAVSRGTGIPKDRLATLLRETYGMPFKPFLNELRLTEAMRLLRETDRTVSEIAFAVGYNTHTHFSRVFRERHSSSPVEWRERMTVAPRNEPQPPA